MHLVFDNCSPDGLVSALRSRLDAAAMEYYALTGTSFTVTSTRRTLRRQAELMAAFSLEQLEAMYCRNGYPSYIREIAKLPAPYSADIVYKVLQNRTEGYISKHLTGQAADISANLAAPDMARQCLKHAGLVVLDETEMGVSCLHVSLPGPPSEIIRE